MSRLVGRRARVLETCRACVVAVAVVATAGAIARGQPASSAGRRADRDFRASDTRLLAAFAALEALCAGRWHDDECRRPLGALQAREERLFGEVAMHHFSDITESNYWHRGRMKFPSQIAQTLRLLAEADSRGASEPPSIDAQTPAAPCPDPVTVDQTLVDDTPGWQAFGFIRDGIRALGTGDAARSSNHHPTAIDIFAGPPTELHAIAPDAPRPGSTLDIRWTLPQQAGRPFWMVCRYSGTYLTLGRALPPGVTSCEARLARNVITTFGCR